MSNIEEKIMSIKSKLKDTQIPENLDSVLVSKLETVATRRNRFKQITQYLSVAVVIILLSLTFYNHQSLAYYSKKILGFDDFYGTVGILNEEEKGQVIDETIELEEGLSFTVNGIMTDTNQLVLFYTFAAPDGLEQSNRDKYQIGSITGFKTKATTSGGTSRTNDLGTEEKGIFQYSAVHPMAKKLTIHLWDMESDEPLELIFPHDPNKAMKASLDVPINESMLLDIGTLTIDTVTATPTMTLVKGNIKKVEQENLKIPLLGVKLLANGHTVGRSGSGYSFEEGTGIIDFEIDFNTLPEDVHDLKVKIERFTGYKEINDTMSTAIIGESFNFYEEDVEISDLSIVDGQLELTLVSDENILLDELSIDINGKDLPGELVEDMPSFQSNVKRTYQFNVDEIPEEINVEGMYYLKNYGDEIDIPVK